MKKKKFLFVSPHPDDAELGAGGTVIKLKKEGHRVWIVDLTDGEPTPFGSKEKRRKEAERAGRLLGIDRRVNLGLENRYLFDERRGRLALAEQIRIFQPDAVFCPFAADAHPDHWAASTMAQGARFYAKYSNLSLKGKPFYPRRLFYYFCAHLRIVPWFSFLVDISDSFTGKMNAVRAYRSQFTDNAKNRFVFDYIKTQNRFFGHLARTEYAEPVYSQEAVSVADFGALT